MGHMMVDAVVERDYPLVVGGVLLTSTLVTIGSALADILGAVADPRIEQGR
jgi:ABC-type dipeptide/oligopeptide/nickel transport system permease component